MKKFISLFFVIVVIFTQSISVFAWWDEVEREPNDSMSTADSTKIDMGNTMTVYGTVGPNDKKDFFKFTPKEVGDGKFRLYIRDDSKDYDLFLYHQSGKLITSSINNAGDNELIDYGLQRDITYYLEVRYISGGYANEPYRLRLDLN